MNRDIETTVQDMHKIAEIKIIATWTDGRTEDLATHMPESLAEQIEVYCDELEEHRAEVGEDYNFDDPKTARAEAFASLIHRDFLTDEGDTK